MTRTFQERAVRRIRHNERFYDSDFMVRDLLADLRHFCQRQGLDFANEDRIAYDNYLSEATEDYTTRHDRSEKTYVDTRQ